MECKGSSKRVCSIAPLLPSLSCDLVFSSRPVSPRLATSFVSPVARPSHRLSSLRLLSFATRHSPPVASRHTQRLPSSKTFLLELTRASCRRVHRCHFVWSEKLSQYLRIHTQSFRVYMLLRQWRDFARTRDLYHHTTAMSTPTTGIDSGLMICT